MNARLALIQQWRTNLAESEGKARDNSPRLRWMHQMRSRLYRFLLSYYGRGDWRAGDATQPANAFCNSAIAPVFIDNRDGAGGKAPKSVGRIRSVLKKVHAANDRGQLSKPPSRALAPNDWIVVRSSDSRTDFHRSAELMKQCGIPARSVVNGATSQLEVRVGRYSDAMAFLARNHHFLRKTDRVRLPVAVATRIVCGAIGSCPGMIVGFLVGWCALESIQITTGTPEMYVLTFATVGWIVGAVLGATLAGPVCAKTAQPIGESRYVIVTRIRSNWSIVARSSRFSPRRCKDLLSGDGITVRLRPTFVNGWVVEVPPNQAQRASEILNSNMSQILRRDDLTEHVLAGTPGSFLYGVARVLAIGATIVLGIMLVEGKLSLPAFLTLLGWTVAIGIAAHVGLLRSYRQAKIDADDTCRN